MKAPRYVYHSHISHPFAADVEWIGYVIPEFNRETKYMRIGGVLALGNHAVEGTFCVGLSSTVCKSLGMKDISHTQLKVI